MNTRLKMSIVSKNQVKNIPSVSPISQSITSFKSFNDIIKSLLDDCQNAFGMENKMKIVLQIYKFINNEIGNLIQKKWIKFICVVFDKIIELETEYHSGSWNQIDKKLVKTLLDELYKAKFSTIKIIKNYDETAFDIVSKTKEKIASLECQRPRRNIQRVDYTGMDSIEPENEFDGITNIWEDLTIKEDPDYEFEEDQDDEEFMQKVKPELSAEEKSELKQHLSQLVDSHRIRRNVARVNYAGMDMNEEDEGQLHIAKRCFEDGKVKYIWKSYSLSQANEIDDDDYVDEE